MGKLVGVAAVVGLVLVALTLAASIVTLIKVYKNDDNKSDASCPGNPNNGGSSNNVYPPPQGESQVFHQTSEMYVSALNVSINPCNDFYSYVCGSYSSHYSTFTAAQYEVLDIMLKGILLPSTNADSRAVNLTKSLYTACKRDYGNWTNVLSATGVLSKQIDQFRTNTGILFPLLDSVNVTTELSPTTLGSVIGYLSGVIGTDTLLTFYVDTNWVSPQGDASNIPYRLYIDQPTLLNSWSHYIGDTWNLTKRNLNNTLFENFYNYQATVNKTIANATILAAINDALDFEYLLANSYSANSTIRWNQSLLFNPTTVENFTSTYKNIDIGSAFKNLLTYAGPKVQALFNNKDAVIVLNEPGHLANLNNDLPGGFSGKISVNTILNYFYFRLLNSLSEYIPSPKSLKEQAIQKIHIQKRHRGRPKHEPSITQKILREHNDADDDFVSQMCIEQTIELLPYSNARILIDQLYPTPEARLQIRQQLGLVIQNIIIGMQSMIDQLSWMSKSTKDDAYKKILSLVRNVAYPDFIVDNALLDAYYSELQNYESSTSYIDISNYLQQFNTYVSYNVLTRNGNVDRLDWNGPPGIINAWYQPELNSITFPVAILRQPFFDPAWPVALNFGGMGLVSGHELSHGFDSSGTQWDGVGKMVQWLKGDDLKSFENMTQCVIDEYSNFCPLDANQYSPNCINGQQTVGENVADNGGIHSSYRGYRNAQNLIGTQQVLTGEVGSQFTHDQLYFLAFAHVWCAPPPSQQTEYNQILVDPHSPARYRVLGTVQNFPAFASAFNCPQNSAASPADHCNVWITPVDTSYYSFPQPIPSS